MQTNKSLMKLSKYLKEHGFPKKFVQNGETLVKTVKQEIQFSLRKV